eukprot:6477153-Amphidinium_carterae.4
MDISFQSHGTWKVLQSHCEVCCVGSLFSPALLPIPSGAILDPIRVMAPKGIRKASKLEQVACLQQKAHRMFVQSNIEWVSMTLRNRPDLVPGVVTHLSQLGCGTPGSMTHEAVGASEQQQPPPSEGSSSVVRRSMSTQSLAGESSVGGGAELDLADETATTGEIPRKYQTIDSLAVVYLLDVLAFCEPVSLSGKALAVYRVKRSWNKVEVLRIFEYVSGIQPEVAIPTEWRAMPQFRSAISDLNVARGRPLRDIVTPVSWPLQGQYQWQFSGSALEIVDKITKNTVKLPLETWGFTETTDIEQMYIEHNWSANRAVLAHPSSMTRPLLALYMSNCSNGEGNIKKRELRAWPSDEVNPPSSKKVENKGDNVGKAQCEDVASDGATAAAAAAVQVLLEVAARVDESAAEPPSPV